MKTLTILYHIARADFLERTRRYSFLIMLGLVMWLGYAAASGRDGPAGRRGGTAARSRGSTDHWTPSVVSLS